MEAFEIKKSTLLRLSGDGLRDIVAGIFPDYTTDRNKFIIRSGALQPMTVWYEDKKLFVEIVTDKNVDSETALKSISNRNRFLEAATGYTSKERLKKLKKGDG